MLALVAKIMSYFPPIMNELIVYSASIICLVASHSEYLILFSGIALSGVIYYSFAKRLSDERDIYIWIGCPLTITFLVLTIAFSSSIFGFFCIIAFLFTFKFAIVIMPGLIIAQSSDNGLKATILVTLLSLILVLATWEVFYTSWLPLNSNQSAVLLSFKPAILSLLPLAFFFGMTRIRLSFHDKHLSIRLLAEIVGFISELALISLALLYQLSFMFWIGVLFLIWHLLEKFYRLIYVKVSFVLACTIFAVIFGSIAAIVKINMYFILPYLTSLSL